MDGMQDTRSVQSNIADNDVATRHPQSVSSEIPVRGDDAGSIVAMGRESSGRGLLENGQGASPDFCADIGQLKIAETTYGCIAGTQGDLAPELRW